MEKIMNGVGVLQNLKEEFDRYSNKIKKNRKYIIEESENRKSELKEFKENYVSRFVELNREIKKTWSKISNVYDKVEILSRELNLKIKGIENQILGVHTSFTEELAEKIKKIKKYINNEIKDYIKSQFQEMKEGITIETELAISKQLNENNKQLIKFMWVIVSLVIVLIVSGIVKFIIDWLIP
jgi:hypothetical protein